MTCLVGPTFYTFIARSGLCCHVISVLIDLCTRLCIFKYMLLHPCECNIRFTSTKPKDRMPEGEVLVNRILHKQRFNNEFISH